MLIIVDYERTTVDTPSGNVIVDVNPQVSPGDFYLNIIAGWREESSSPPVFEAHQGSPCREEWSVGGADHVFRFSPRLSGAISLANLDDLNWEYGFSTDDITGMVRFERSQYEGVAPEWVGEIEIYPPEPGGPTTTVRFHLDPAFEAAYSPPVLTRPSEPEPTPLSSWHRLLED